jgi:hypothetical protein
MMDKKELRLWKNRESAVRSRQKKDALIEQLQGQVRMYSEEISITRSHNLLLRQSIPYLHEMEERNINSQFTQHFLEPAVFKP